MFYERRPIHITDVPPDEAPTVLAKRLSRDGRTHTLCTAFRLPNGTVLVNDATSEDGAGEWAVLVPEPGETYRQVESITFGWMPPVLALRTLRALRRATLADFTYEIARGVRLNPHPDGPCPLCA